MNPDRLPPWWFWLWIGILVIFAVILYEYL